MTLRDAPAKLPLPGFRCSLTDELLSDWEWIKSKFQPDSLVALFEQLARVQYYEAGFATREVRYVHLTSPEVAFWGWPWEIAELDILGNSVGEPSTVCARHAGSGDAG
jgi:hypothetical protein